MISDYEKEVLSGAAQLAVRSLNADKWVLSPKSGNSRLSRRTEIPESG
jgi:hypothetical protein